MTILVSVIVVTFKRQAELVKCIRELKRQDYPNFEIIVVDNNDSDSYLEAVRQTHPDVRFIKAPFNGGPTAGRNLGIRDARGAFCFMVDDDVTITGCSVLSQACAKLESRSNLGAVSLRIVDQNLQTCRNSIPRRDKVDLLEDYRATYFCNSAVLFRTQAVCEAGLYWESLFIDCEELDLSFRMLAKGYEILHVPSLTAINSRSPNGRPDDRYFYRYARNRPIVALRSLPFRFVFSTTVLWWGFLLAKALRYGGLSAFFRGVYEAIGKVPETLRLRRSLPDGILRDLRTYSGRLLY